MTLMAGNHGLTFYSELKWLPVELTDREQNWTLGFGAKF